MYKRNDPTPSYAHIGLDVSASLNKQAHLAQAVKNAIVEAAVAYAQLPVRAPSPTRGLFGRMFSRPSSASKRRGN